MAATGTINIDGSVGDIGGLHQKTVAVKKAGASYFLVPKDQVKEALRRPRAARSRSSA